MLHRLLPANPTLADRFGFFLWWLFFGMDSDWRRRGLRHVHSGEINERIVGLWRRLRSVLERYRAGTLRAGRAREVTLHPGFSPLHGPNPQGERESIGDAALEMLPNLEESSPHPDPPPQVRERGRTARKVPCWSVLPRQFGWLRSLLLPESQGCVTAFHSLLHEDTEMQAAIAAAPVQIGRVLRPFCHFLGLEVPEGLRLPRRQRLRVRPTTS
jgi:hypothetical protein